MKPWLFFIDLIVMISEMCIIGSIFYLVTTAEVEMNLMLWFVFAVNCVMWLFLLFRSLVEMKENLGD